jgi:hypothetical protein
MTDTNNVNNGIIIGAIFSLCSFLLTFTFIIPVFSVVPGAFFELLSSSIVSNDPYSNVGKLTILFLAVALVVIIKLSLFRVEKWTLEHQFLTKKKVISLMMVFYFVVHPLGFYIYWALCLNFRSDGQLIFAAVYSFPVSSLSFVVFGFLLDLKRDSVYKSLKI